MKSHITLISAICVLIAAHLPLQAQQDGAYLFKTYCANCHEGSGADSRAPQADVMKQMTPERILEVLEKDVMKAQAAERKPARGAIGRVPERHNRQRKQDVGLFGTEHLVGSAPLEDPRRPLPCRLHTPTSSAGDDGLP